MSGQELVALGVVLVTAGLFLRTFLVRRRRQAWAKGGCCSGTPRGLGAPQRIVLTGRRGERPRLIVGSGDGTEGKLAGRPGMH